MTAGFSGGGGYSVGRGDRLDKAEIVSLLSRYSPGGASLVDGRPWDERVHLYQRTGSTSSLALEALRGALRRGATHQPDGRLTRHGKDIHGELFLAEEQTGGRGRLGRSFFSPGGRGLYLSLIVLPPGGIRNPALVTVAAAVGVCRSLGQVYGVQAGIKWVNDIFLNGRKVCGILTEGVADGGDGAIPGAVVGIGVNLLPPEGGFPPELAPVAGAVLAPGEERLLRNELAAAIACNVLDSMTGPGDSDGGAPPAILEEYGRLSIIRPGQQIQVFPTGGSPAEAYSATCLGIDGQARLKVRREDGSLRLLDSGEVSLKSSSLASV